MHIICVLAESSFKDSVLEESTKLTNGQQLLCYLECNICNNSKSIVDKSSKPKASDIRIISYRKRLALILRACSAPVASPTQFA